MFAALSHRFQGALVGSLAGLAPESPLRASQQALLAQPGATIATAIPWDLDSAAAALATVPLALLHGESQRELSQQLAQVAAPRLLATEAIASVYLWSTALACCLQAPATDSLLADLSAAIAAEPAATPWSARLADLQAAIAAERDVATLNARLRRQLSDSDRAISLALYSYASTPSQPHLSCARASQVDLPLALPLTAALVGASHGVWHLPAACRPPAQQRASATQAATLLRHWAGQGAAARDRPVPEVAIARQLQARPHCPVISQTD